MHGAELVDNSGALIAALGRWPQFHDASVVSAERREGLQELSIHVFNTTDRVDDRGYFELERHHLVHIRFTGVERNTLPSAYASDCLDRLSISQLDGKILASLQSHMDADGEILCARVEVVSVVPCTASGAPMSQCNSIEA